MALAAALGGCDSLPLPGGHSVSAGSGSTANAGPAQATTSSTAALEGHRTVIDLLTNRVHGLEYHGGRLLLSAGEPAFYKFVDGGWKTNWLFGEAVDGQPAATVNGLSALLYLPVDTDGDGVAAGELTDLPLELTLRSFAPGQRLTVFVNEKPAGTVDVPTAWSPVSVMVPGAALQLGENRVRLTFRNAAPRAGGSRSAAALARVAVGPAGGSLPPRSALVPEEKTLGALSKRAVVLPGPGRLSFYVQVPAGAKLTLAHGSQSSSARVLVRVSRDGASPRTLYEGPTSSAFSEGLWDLDPEVGQAVRIDLVGRGGPTIWGSPRLVVKSPAPPELPKGNFDRIYVWLVDTLRADKLKVYNPKSRVHTPNYDAFAADATRFAWNHVPGTWSMPSHASMLTGVYPTIHKAIAHEARLSKEVPFLAELLKKGGYRTGLFSSNGYVSAKWGFDRGWDETRNFIREGLPSGADYLWKTTKAWLDEPAQKGKQQFLYLATIEPHVAYNPKKEFLARYWNKPYKGPIKPEISGVQSDRIKAGKLKVNDNDKAYLEALYDGEITQSDSLFAGFIADLKARGIYDTTAVIVTSDHGDEFWEHGDVGHHQGVYQELVHVPLIIRAPGLFPRGRVVQADVEAMDLFPTILDLAGVAIPKGTQGSSLLPVVHDEVGLGPRAALSQNLASTRGLKVGRYRLIHGGLARVELYDELEDPREKSDLATRRPIALRHMRNVFGLLHAYESRWRKRAWGTAANVTDVFYSEVGAR